MASRRQYLSQAELTQYADITISNTTEADDQISQAEELIDGYVGYQQKFIPEVMDGLASAGAANGLTLENPRMINVFQKNFFIGCEIEIIGGTAKGDRRIITAQQFLGVITCDSAWSTATDATSYYRIYQLGKFPRYCDVTFDGIHSPQQYYKYIPEAVKRATAAQVEYMIKMGASYFNTDASTIESEHIGDYSYTKGKGGASHLLIAPKAKEYLRGIMNRKGTMVLGNGVF